MRRRVSLARIVGACAMITVAIAGVSAQNKEDIQFDPNFHIYLLIGQSNMEGAPRPESTDLSQNPRIKVLAYTNAPRLKRIYNEWAIAVPPLHSTYQGLGPGDNFAKTVLAAMPANVTIGLVPCGINGVDIDFFLKGVVSKRRKEFQIPPDNHWDGAYEWVISRAKIAQKYGVIKGILFHQGESDAGQRIWLDKVNTMVSDLRKDLNIPDAPILIGELLYTGPCSGHNQVIKDVPTKLKNAYVISAKGLKGQDQFHFDLAGQRELGKRYGDKMIELLLAK